MVSLKTLNRTTSKMLELFVLSFMMLKLIKVA